MDYFKAMEATNSWMRLGLHYTQMNMAAAEVIAHRVMRMSQGTMSASEAMQMVMEKGSSMALASEKAAMAAVKGSSPVEIATAAIGPLRAATRSNAKRLRG
ncbi:hypothetical protein [Amaricoccus tamworthensis]|uniref:hypothetical protein n=1 Tax=Amaricoccus tamworthensis TaxID=57002 RepID=UPI003C7CA253